MANHQHQSLRRCKADARRLFKALRRLNGEALQRAESALPNGSPRLAEIRAARVKLSDALWIVALEQGDRSWSSLKHRLTESVEDRADNTPFNRALEAIRAGDQAALSEHVAKHPDLISAFGDHGYSLLHHVASSGTLRLDEPQALAKTLLDAGMDPSIHMDGHDTPLHFAASLGHMAVLELLLAAGARTDLNGGVDNQADGGTPLAHALVYGCSQAADRLAAEAVAPLNLRVAAGLGRLDLMAGFFDEAGNLLPSAGRRRDFYRPHDEFPSWTPGDRGQEILDEALCYAVVNRRSNEVFDFLLDRGADPSHRPYDKAPLHQPALEGDERIVNYLLDNGADPCVCDLMYQSPAWEWARFGGHPRVASRLLEVGARNHLMAAVEIGSLDAVIARVEAGDDVSQGFPRGSSPLSLALELGEDSIAALLESRGARLNLESAAALGDLSRVKALVGQSEKLEEALTAAVTHGRIEVVDFLLARGASLRPHDAAVLGRTRLLEKALADGMPVDQTRDDGKSLLHRAIQGHQPETVQFLLEKGADVDLPSDFATYGPRALHVAAMFGAPDEILDLLIEAGSEVNEGMNGGTPLDWAAREGHEPTVKALKQRGARTAQELGDWPFNRLTEPERK